MREEEGAERARNRGAGLKAKRSVSAAGNGQDSKTTRRGILERLANTTRVEHNAYSQHAGGRERSWTRALLP